MSSMGRPARTTSALSVSDSQRPLQTAAMASASRSPSRAQSSCGVVDEHAEVVQVGAVVTSVEPRRDLLHDGQPERLEHGQQLAQRDLAAERRDRHARQRAGTRLRVLGQLVLQPDRERLARGDALEQLDVVEREPGEVADL